jgi:hypothetical protein
MNTLIGRATILALALVNLCGCSSSDQTASWIALDAGGRDGIGAADGAAGKDGSVSLLDSNIPDNVINLDSNDDSAGCSALNIGILGQEGSNPSSDFQKWLQDRGTSVTRFQTDAAEPLTSAALAQYDIAILDRLVREYAAADAAIIQAWTEAGHGLVSMSGYANDPGIDFRANVLLAPLGVAYTGSIMDGPVVTFSQHPITQGITSITFLGGYQIDNVTASSTRTVFATINSSAVGYAIELGSGRAVVWGDEWIEFDSQWSSLPEIQQFWANIVDWIKPSDKCGLVLPK